MMRYNTHICIDAAFRSTPSSFTQCLIIMLNVPCVYVIMTSKNEYLYLVVLHELVFSMEMN
ncbi:hypothetical protein HZS_2745 [Henneguya salminicola]|nr:hypothetical protein HZS_2745 [Henneguya salminicola]